MLNIAQIGVGYWGPNMLRNLVANKKCKVPFVEIQKGVKLGNGTKIQSHSFICQLVTIGEECVDAHGIMFINDTFPAGKPSSGNRDLWEKTVIAYNVSIGSNATILPVNICSNVVIGAGSIVTKNILKPGIYAGTPAKFLRCL